jgi:subtilisin
MRSTAFALFSFFTFVIPSIPLQAAGPPTAVSAASGLVPPCEDSSQVPSQARVPCLGLALFAATTSFDIRANAIARANAGLRFNYRLVNAAAVFIPNAASLSALLVDANVLAIIPDRPMHAIDKPAAPGGKKGNSGNGGGSGQVVPSGVESIGAAPNSLPVTGANVGVAIVDTGIDLPNPDLNVGSRCYDAFDGDCQDDDGHGTHVAGIVAARDNTTDVVGVAPEATVYAVKVLDQNGNGSDSTVMAGLEWVGVNAGNVDPPIRVVNMSLGRAGSINDNPALRDLVASLHDDYGISVIVAAGNDPTTEVSQQVPATYPGVMAVASTSALGGKNSCKFYNGFVQAETASYFTTDGKLDSNTGIGVTISAPGEKQEDINRGCFIQSTGILSLKLGGGTTRMSGTSMAAPHVAGVAALMQQSGALLPEEIRQSIRTGAQQLGGVPLDSPASSYTFDGEREGVVSACAVLGAC